MYKKILPAILFILISISTKLFPKFFNEQFSFHEIIQEVVAIVIIIVGLGLIILN